MAVVTENSYGKGRLTYIGAYPSQQLLDAIVRRAAIGPASSVQRRACSPSYSVWGQTRLERSSATSFNYSSEEQGNHYNYPTSEELVFRQDCKKGDR